MSGSAPPPRRSRTVDVAEAARLALLRVVQPARPVDRDVALAAVQPRRPLHAAAARDPAELKQPVEHRAVVAHVVPRLLLRVRRDRVRRDARKKVHIVVRVELAHLRPRRRLRAVHLHPPVQPVVHHQRVRQPDAVRLHRVPRSVRIVAHVAVVEVRNRPPQRRARRNALGQRRRRGIDSESRRHAVWPAVGQCSECGV
ncbi:hypothetical protein NEOLI_003650 [Neolecta irregularis DAH-3]|uniref:Uncharacterized protein n=1 Tax=Neolecta irregularis (strain DAH-3) TaxID=1198029 RepID=A0A1U7LSL1_NEOID|nr:hypothetical protein NEOLI_003650 [Neolecta irregularis DAH-3]|eukprot:OLL25660.1 hypothetical protein NEOLI_003650 [Neolecta irregularis DAH-3]